MSRRATQVLSIHGPNLPRSLLPKPDETLALDTEEGSTVDFVKYELDDGGVVYFESAEADLVSLRDGDADVVDGGKLGDRLTNIAHAAQEVSQGLRDRLDPDEIELTFGVKISGGVGWWWFGKADGEASIQVKATWKAAEPGTPAEGGPNPPTMAP